MSILRHALALFLSILVISSTVPAQSLSSASQINATAGTVKPDAKRARKALELGEKAEAAGRLGEALTEFEEAAQYAPRDANIVERAAALRSKLIRAHSEAAERDALAGHLDEATDELAAALAIDPGDTIVAERLGQLKSMEDGSAPHIPEISGLPRLKPKPGKQSLSFSGDTKTVYEQVARSFGVKVIFDSDLTARSVRLNLDNIDFNTALTILGGETGTFWRPVNSELMFVAQDTPEKRRQYELEAEETFPLSSAVSAEDATEVMRILRDITGSTRITLDSNSRSITMRDTPERLTLANQLMRQIERARGEVMLEIELLEVDTNKARALGITPPTQTRIFSLSTSQLNQIRSSTDLANLITNLQQVFAGQGFTGIPSVVAVGGGLSTFLLTLPTAAANFSDSLSLVQSGRQVLLRAQEGKPASFFVGDRFPVTLSLLSGSLGVGAATTGVPGSTIFPETSFSVGANPSALVAGPFTGGTLPDLAVVFNDPNANTFEILQNQDNGNFVQFTPSPITLGANEKGQVAIATGTFRDDPTKFTTTQPADLVLVNSTSNTISVLLGNSNANGAPNGTFTEAPGSPFTVGTNPSSVVVADFNGDGFLDIAVANRGDNTITLLEGHGDGTFTPFPASPFKLTNTNSVSETAPVAMVSANFRNNIISTLNSTPEVDLAVVNEGSNNVTILLSSVDQNKNVTFQEAPKSPIAVGTLPVAIAAGDLDGNGVPDLAVVNQTDGTVSVLLGSPNLDGTFTPALGSPLTTGTTPAGVVIANFANGTVPDIAVTNKGSNTLSVFIDLGQGLFASPVELNVNNASSPGSLIASALTSSGLPDVALVAQGASSSQGVVVVVQDTTNFSNTITNGTTQTPYPGSEYVDLGVKIKATPTLHPNNEVTLQLEFEIRALAGTSVNGIPILSNRTLSQTVRVKEDEPTLIAGLTDTEETRFLTGLPGFAEIPGAKYAFSTKNNTLQDTELLIVITPRKLRLVDHLTTPIYAGRGDSTRRGGGTPFREAPGEFQRQPQPPPPQPPQQQQQPQQQPQP